MATYLVTVTTEYRGTMPTWIRRYKVTANTLLGALRKASTTERFPDRLRRMNAYVDRQGACNYYRVQDSNVRVYAETWGTMHSAWVDKGVDIKEIA